MIPTVSPKKSGLAALRPLSNAVRKPDKPAKPEKPDKPDKHRSTELYPTLNNLQEVFDLAAHLFTGEQRNEVVSLLMIYQNTLLETLKQRTNARLAEQARQERHPDPVDTL